MKSVNEITDAIKFPQINDIFDQPIKPGNIIICGGDQIYMYVITDQINLKAKEPWIKLIYIDDRAYYDYTSIKMLYINRIGPDYNNSRIINITKIASDSIKKLAKIYFNVFKSQPDNIKNVQTKTIFNMLNA